MIVWTRLTGLAPLLALAPALGAQDEGWNGDSFALFEGLYRSRRVHFEVPSGPCEPAAARLAEVLRARGEFEVSLAPDEADPAAVRVLVGAPLDPGFEPLAYACGIETFEGGFQVFGRDYTAPGDAALAVFEDPERAGRPLFLVLGNDKELLARYLDEIPRLSRPYLWVYADGELALECPLGPAGRPRAELVRDYRDERERLFADAPKLALDNLVVHAAGEPEAARWRAYRMSLALARRRVLAWFEVAEAPPVELFLYDHPEDFERCVGRSELALADRLHPRVHALLAPGMPDDGGAALARVLARELAGEPAAPWIADGLAVAAAERWWGRPLDDWLAHLALAKLLPAPEELQDSAAAGRLSEHVLGPARALLFQSATKNAAEEPGRVRALWKGAELGDKRIDAAYQRSALEKARRSAPPGKAPGAGARRGKARAAVDDGQRARQERMSAAPVRHGLALVQGETSYAARALDDALGAARALGPGLDALSLTVFGTVEDPAAPFCTLAPRAVHGSASDLALAHACAAARGAELRVLLALEVLAQPGGSWADNISWTAADASDVFFERYRRVALHYALVSELCGVEVFSFGANLREASRTDPKLPVRDPQLFERRRAGWKELIERLHAAYDGGLTYTARFPAEGQETGFFEQLDYIGVALYPRLAQGQDEPDDPDLRRALRFELHQALDLAVRWNKPLLLVQLGFPARAESWAASSLPRGAHDPGAQRRFYSALVDVLDTASGPGGRLENVATLRGFYLWNWPLEAHGPWDTGYALRGRPVEVVLRQLFSR